jgi:hypothetical protein
MIAVCRPNSLYRYLLLTLAPRRIPSFDLQLSFKFSFVHTIRRLHWLVIGDVSVFSAMWIHPDILVPLHEGRLSLWSSGQSSWLQIQGSRGRFPGNTKKKVVGLERGSLSLVSTTEELLDRKVAAPV